jgi:hypothetical protein
MRLYHTTLDRTKVEDRKKRKEKVCTDGENNIRSHIEIFSWRAFRSKNGEQGSAAQGDQGSWGFWISYSSIMKIDVVGLYKLGPLRGK